MKRYIRSDYIPDMTERYPEGQSRPYDPGLDDEDAPVFILRDRIQEYMQDAEDGDWYNIARVSKAGEIIYETNSLEDLLTWAEKTGYADARLDSSWWHDADILFTLKR